MWFDESAPAPDEPIRIVIAGRELDGWWWDGHFYKYPHSSTRGILYGERCQPGTVARWRRRTKDDTTLTIAHPRITAP